MLTGKMIKRESLKRKLKYNLYQTGQLVLVAVFGVIGITTLAMIGEIVGQIVK